MNFIEEFKKGKAGGNEGLPMGEGLTRVSRAINHIQKGMLIGVAAAPKVGKSTLIDSGMIIEVWLYCLLHNILVEFIYFSYEIDRVSKEFDFCAFFLNYDYQITHVLLEEGSTFEGEKEIPLSAAYLRGRLKDDQDRLISVKPSIKTALQETYQRRIIPLFGEYAQNGTLISKGIIVFIEHRENPTGVRNLLLRHAKDNGRFTHETFRDKEGKSGKKVVGYTPSNPDKHTIVVMDHLRKLLPERNFQMKQTVDKMIEYFVELRNWCNWTIIAVIHLNRSMTDPYRLKMYGDSLYPNGDDIKDTGNFSEECDHLFTMFNPNDERYNLRKHFGKQIKDASGNDLYPNMRTVHLVESRHVFFPQHFRVNMLGNIKKFTKLEI